MRRLEVFDFPYSFVEHPDPNNDNERQIDQQLKKEKVGGPLWRQQMMRMLTAIYAQGVVTTNIPSAVLQASQDAFDNSNPLKAWHDECVTHTHNERDAYTPAHLYELYCGVKGGAAVSDKAFWSSLAMNNIIQKRSNGKRMYVRIKVLSQADLDAQAAFEAFRMDD